MFKNLSIKFLAIVLAVIFWFFVVSLENTFYRFPEEVPIQVFNQAEDLALATKLGGVHLAIRASDPATLRTLTTADFEAYIDLRNMAEGTRKMEVFVTSKKPQVSVLRVTPAELEVTLEPLAEKSVSLKAEVLGEPFRGYEVDSVKLSVDKIKLTAAESVLAKIGQVKAEVQLDGTEDERVTKNVVIKIYDAAGAPLEGIKIADAESVEATLNIVETESRRDVGVKAKFSGALKNGSIKNIEVEPAVVSITGSRGSLDAISFVETEAIDLTDLDKSFDRTVKLNLPAGVVLATGQRREIRIKVEIEK